MLMTGGFRGDLNVVFYQNMPNSHNRFKSAIWNPIDFQGQSHRVKFLGKGIRHALRCPCYKSK
jgi:hypothetical protein